MPNYSGPDEEAAVEAGVFNVTARRQKLPTTETNPYVNPEIRVPLKILSNANVAPRWIELGCLADRKTNNLRQHVIHHDASRCTGASLRKVSGLEHEPCSADPGQAGSPSLPAKSAHSTGN